MKLLKLKGLMTLLAGFLLLSFTEVKAQCPYFIENQLQCKVTVDITIYKPQGSTCNNVCVAYTGVVIYPGTNVPINCMGCNVCNIEVTVTDIGGIPVSASPADLNSFFPGVPLSGGGCPSNGICFSPVTPGGVFKIF